MYGLCGICGHVCVEHLLLNKISGKYYKLLKDEKRDWLQYENNPHTDTPRHQERKSLIE